MLWTQRLWLRLQSLFRGDRAAQQLHDEVRFHLDQQIAENIAAGMSPEKARHAAKRTFGNVQFEEAAVLLVNHRWTSQLKVGSYTAFRSMVRIAKTWTRRGSSSGTSN